MILVKNNNIRSIEKNREKKEKKLTRKMRKRLVGLYVVVLLVLIALSGFLTFYNTQKGDEYAAQVLSKQTYGSKIIPYQRGDILDTNGNVLATSVKVYNLILDPVIILSNEKYLEPTITALTECFTQLDRNTLLETINTKSSSRYVVTLKQLQYEEIKNLNEILTTKKDENPYVKGIWFEEEYKRMYPYNSLASTVIGFTESGNVGRWGIEEYYNDYLNGTDGREFGYVNEDNIMDPVKKSEINGQTVVSTIDLTLQTICEKWIGNWVEEYHPETVAVILANPNNGEILAMADNKNMYDLNNPRDLTRYYTQEAIDAMTEEEYLDNLSKMWRNYCISDSYEPGSTIKPFTVAAALEEGKITQDQTFVCDGFEYVGGFRIKCHKTSGHGTLNVEQALMNSCNDALMSIAFATGKQLFCDYQAKFGFGMKTSIDLPGEASCENLLFSPDNMADSSLATNSFGQTFNVTMVQMVAGFSSLINGGNYYQPHVVRQILNSDGGVVENIDDTLIKQTVTAKTSDFIRHAMWQTVEAGTGKTAKVDGYLVGGKTGTAQHLDKTDSNYLLSFLGFAPYDNPQVVCYVIVDSPQVEDKGSSAYASKLFSAIMTEALPYMNIFPTNPEEIETTTPEPQETESTMEEETSIPLSPSEDETYEEGGLFAEPESGAGENTNLPTPGDNGSPTEPAGDNIPE